MGNKKTIKKNKEEQIMSLIETALFDGIVMTEEDVNITLIKNWRTQKLFLLRQILTPSNQ